MMKSLSPSTMALTPFKKAVSSFIANLFSLKKKLIKNGGIKLFLSTSAKYTMESKIGTENNPESPHREVDKAHVQKSHIASM